MGRADWRGMVVLGGPSGLFPLLVEGFLIVRQQAIDLLVGRLHDPPAGAGFTVVVGGGIVPKAIHGDIAVDQDDLELQDLVLRQVQLLFEGL